MPRKTVCKKIACLTPGCKNVSKTTARGLCAACYQAALNLIKSKKATWQLLEEMKLARPSVYKQRKKKVKPFDKAFKDANNGKQH